MSSEAASSKLLHQFFGTVKCAALVSGLSSVTSPTISSFNEIVGLARAMIKHCKRVEGLDEDGVDIVGTGGDGANTVNIHFNWCFNSCCCLWCKNCKVYLKPICSHIHDGGNCSYDGNVNCKPMNSSWNNVNCSYNGNNSPKLRHCENLSSSDLTGEIAPALFGLKSLKYL
ncbi:hypothetical protein LOK49_Contig185G00006 [Camellia lanceoleosa]|nr:hypothetical protein LOK49_Contig185G00006 [Camellia lanceoleosa]